MWMSKDCHGEVSKMPSTLAEHWKDAHLVGKLKRADEQLLVMRGLTRSARAGQRQVRDEKWNLDSVKAVLNRIQECKASTEIDTSVDKQKYITNQVLDEYSRTPLCTKCALDTGTHCRARFEITLYSRDVREIESLKSTGATVEVNTTNDQMSAG